ncbi:MAG: 3-dehydroquinate synthase [Chloroflexi bacterium]|nr:3-dehydroquinate synthase [Chloroflexota bacterium]
MSKLILTGFAGTGKTAIGREAARLLAWEFVDTDDEITRRAGKPVERVFAEDGEPAFRRLEAQVLAGACARTASTVIATGGGAVVDDGNRALMLRSGVVVCLEARPETIYQRLFDTTSGGPNPIRPLLADPDPLGRIRQLKGQRQPAYALAHWTVHTDTLTVGEAAREVVRAWDALRGRLRRPTSSPGTEGSQPTEAGERTTEVSTEGTGPAPAAVVHSSVGPCPIYVGWGLLEQLGGFCQRAGLASVAYCISDETVSARYQRRVQISLEDAGIPMHSFIMPPGEPSKSLEVAGQAYRFLAHRRAERGHFIVALGGGVVGDLAGFVAATYNRGMPFIQLPTSLAAMVDASIGGKTAVNLPAGKNLVGAFHQPRFVLADVRTLTSLPPRELASGWAEAVKHGLILDADLLRAFEAQAEALGRLDPEAVVPVLQRSIAIKAQVVTKDERETLGIRTLLNYGHTIGHALEAATEYGQLLHGEAVAIGMTAAAHISHRMGLLDAEGVARQQQVLERFHLPLRSPPVRLDAVRAAMQVDKKTAGKTIRWVLLEGIGRAVARDDVPSSLVEEAVREVAPGA